MAGELGAALATVLRQPVELSVAGRTDRGVHALGQVASYDGPLPNLRSVNAVLPHEIVVLDAREAPAGFSARRDARSRTYLYRVLARRQPSPFERGRALWWPHRVDVEALETCARALLGTHDFTAFTPTDTAHRHFSRNVIDAAWSRESEAMLAFEIEADAFLRGMVRSLIGTILEVGAGRRTIEEFERLLRGARREEAGDSMDPHGLYLLRVGYGRL